MPSLEQIAKERAARGEKVKDFLSQAEVDALLKGVTAEDDYDEDDKISEYEWASAMAESDKEHARLNKRPRHDWETVSMSVSDWRKILELLEQQPIREFYGIYTTILCNIPRL